MGTGQVPEQWDQCLVSASDLRKLQNLKWEKPLGASILTKFLMPKLDTERQRNLPSKNPMNLESEHFKVNSMPVDSAVNVLA